MSRVHMLMFLWMHLYVIMNCMYCDISFNVLDSIPMNFVGEGIQRNEVYTKILGARRNLTWKLNIQQNIIN